MEDQRFERVTVALHVGQAERRTYRSKFFDIVVRSSEGCQSDLLGELSECWVSKQGGMSEQFVTYVGLRGVERFAGVADVLSGMEDPEGQSGQEISGGQQPRYRT